jgi:hypothetical protein
VRRLAAGDAIRISGTELIESMNAAGDVLQELRRAHQRSKTGQAKQTDAQAYQARPIVSVDERVDQRLANLLEVLEDAGHMFGVRLLVANDLRG